MISDAFSKIIRNKHASIHTLLAVKGSEGACISELPGIVKRHSNNENEYRKH